MTCFFHRRRLFFVDNPPALGSIAIKFKWNEEAHKSATTSSSNNTLQVVITSPHRIFNFIMARFSIIALATLLPSATMAFMSSTTPSTMSNTALFSKNAQDQPRTAPSWTQSSAPAATAVADSPSSSAGSVATEDATPNQVNLWTNVLDTPRGQKQRDLPRWARQS